jgi:hypothetical protein
LARSLAELIAIPISCSSRFHLDFLSGAIMSPKIDPFQKEMSDDEDHRKGAQDPER